MANELVKASPVSVPVASGAASLPALVERAGAAGRFAWEEFFFAEHHNPHTQKAYMAAVKALPGLVRGAGAGTAGITPGMVGQYLVGLGGSPPSGICTCRRYAASSTGWCNGMSSSSTRRRRSAASRNR